MKANSRWLTALAVGVLIGLRFIVAEEGNGDSSPLLARQENRFLTAREQWREQPESVIHARAFAREAFLLVELFGDQPDPKSIAKAGVEAAREAVRLDPDDPASHFYLAVNLGQIARQRRLGALRLVGKMEKHLKLSAELNPDYHYGAALRTLGILYREAPGWPLSIGNRSEARARLQASLERHPDYPGNKLEWVESLIQWGEIDKARRLFPRLRQVMEDAREGFAGEEWERVWDKWEEQYEEVREKLGLADGISGFRALQLQPALS